MSKEIAAKHNKDAIYINAINSASFSFNFKNYLYMYNLIIDVYYWVLECKSQVYMIQYYPFYTAWIEHGARRLLLELSV